nr:hypothetical protein [Paenibacillus amylolyticus]
MNEGLTLVSGGTDNHKRVKMQSLTIRQVLWLQAVFVLELRL